MNSTAGILDAYSSDYVKLAWMVPPVERSGDDLHITNYNKVSFNPSNETHYGGDFNRKFCLGSRFFFLLMSWLCSWKMSFCVYKSPLFFNVIQKNFR